MSEQKQIDLTKLSEPFPADDIEWRVSRAGTGKKGGIYCNCLAYITARAIQSRLDNVCSPANWRNEQPAIIEIRPGITALVGGISINIGGEWVTKWDVAEPTNIEPAKGGFSGSMKRAGAQWGIGRYLYRLDEAFAEVSEKGGKDWNYAKLPKDKGGETYYWKSPSLPSWALPQEKEYDISPDELNKLKRAWIKKFEPDSTDKKNMQEGFARFVISVVGEFPSSDYTCWTKPALEQCMERIQSTDDPKGPDSDVPFQE